jgi:hypothetical protein
MGLIERLREAEEVNRDYASDADCDPKHTVNWKHADAIKDGIYEIERLREKLDKQERLQDSCYRAGMKFGWNCAVSDDRERYNAALKETE